MNITGLNTGSATNSVNPDGGLGVSSLGNEGDIIEGVVRKVSDKVSIDFNGREYNFPGKAVQDATEGKSILFQIMDVSDDRIVLKTMGNPQGDDRQSAGILCTLLETGSVYEDAQNRTSKDNSGINSDNNHSNINNITEEDVKSAQDVCGDNLSELEEYNLEAFDRLLAGIKDKNTMKTDIIEGYQGRVEEIRQAVENAVIKNRLPQGISEVLARYFLMYDIPVTTQKLEDIGNALNQFNGITQISDRTVIYMLKSETQISISGLYNSVHMGGTVRVYDTCDEGLLEQLRPQIEGILKQAGYDVDEQHIGRAAWLLANDIPIDRDNLDKLERLLDISRDGLDSKAVLQTIMEAVARDEDPSEANLYDVREQLAKAAVRDFNLLTDDDIKAVISEGRIMNLESLRLAHISISRSDIRVTDNDVNVITARRQLEEIRLGMTIQSARTLVARGIDIDTTKLQDIVDELRQLERDNIEDMFRMKQSEPSEAEVDQAVMTIEYRRMVATAPSYTLGIMQRLDESGRGNLTEYARIAAAENTVLARVGEAYESVMTRPRSDMGDSIQKAFANLDGMIDELGIENNETNQRIIRILAHNRMDINTDSIELMKNYDAKMQYMLKGLKPDTVIELIRQQKNPLNMSVDELNTAISEINENIADTRKDRGESNYSKFLWKLEKENKISPEERESYIGICRLLRHISKYDTSAVGAVADSGMELTLKNLMTVVRSRRDAGIDTIVNDSYGSREQVRQAQIIDDQISRAFEYNANNSIVDNVYTDATPSALHEIAAGDINNIMDMPLWQLEEELLHSSASDEIDRQYSSMLAKEIVTNMSDDKVMEFIKAYELEPTVYTLNAVSSIMSTGQTVLKDMLGLNRTDNSDDVEDSEEYDNFKEAVDGLVDALTDEETMTSQSEIVTRAAREYLESVENGPLSDSRLEQFRVMSSGIRLNAMMSDRRSYEIPIVTDSGVTNINLTLVRDEGSSKGTVNIRVDSERYGNISVEYKVQGKRLQGLMLTEKNDADSDLLYKSVEEAAGQAGFEVVSFNRIVHKVKGAYVPDANQSNIDAGITQLYRLAKKTIQSLVRIDR